MLFISENLFLLKTISIYLNTTNTLVDLWIFGDDVMFRIDCSSTFTEVVDNKSNESSYIYRI